MKFKRNPAATAKLRDENIKIFMDRRPGLTAKEVNDIFKNIDLGLTASEIKKILTRRSNVRQKETEEKRRNRDAPRI